MQGLLLLGSRAPTRQRPHCRARDTDERSRDMVTLDADVPDSAADGCGVLKHKYRVFKQLAGGRTFMRVHWVAVPKAMRARRLNKCAGGAPRGPQVPAHQDGGDGAGQDHRLQRRWAPALFPWCARPMLTEIYLCHAHKQNKWDLGAPAVAGARRDAPLHRGVQERREGRLDAGPGSVSALKSVYDHHDVSLDQKRKSVTGIPLRFPSIIRTVSSIDSVAGVVVPCAPHRGRRAAARVARV
jgi:hypothetical protein